MAVVCVCFGAALFLWPGVAAREASAPLAQRGTVRFVPPGQRLGGTPGQKGATYFALAGRTRRLTTRFGKSVAVAETTADGDIHTVLRDGSGRELSRLLVNRVDADRDIVQFTTGADTQFQAFGEPGVRMTMDWANRQAYSLSSDDAGQAEQDVEWRAGFIRRRGAQERDLEREIVQLETEWDEGLTAVTSRRPPARRRGPDGREFTGEAVVTQLSKDGQRVGTTNWFPREQLFIWDLPGLTKGAISPKHLSGVGGWPFTPDLEWMNVQAIAFHHFKTLIDRERFVARDRPGWLRNVAQFVAPVVEANEPGCDGLHWLDGTVLRYCCDVHDGCYAKNGCTSRSWWRVWSSWSCTMCNMWVVDCFEGGGNPILAW